MPDHGWIAAELVLPEEGREVLTWSYYDWGLKKGYQVGGEWFDASHRRINVDYWKSGTEETDDGEAAT